MWGMLHLLMLRCTISKNTQSKIFSQFWVSEIFLWVFEINRLLGRRNTCYTWRFSYFPKDSCNEGGGTTTGVLVSYILRVWKFWQLWIAGVIFCVDRTIVRDCISEPRKFCVFGHNKCCKTSTSSWKQKNPYWIWIKTSSGIIINIVLLIQLGLYLLANKPYGIKGPDGGISASKYCYMGGFDATRWTFFLWKIQFESYYFHNHAFVSIMYVCFIKCIYAPFICFDTIWIYHHEQSGNH